MNRNATECMHWADWFGVLTQLCMLVDQLYSWDVRGRGRSYSEELLGGDDDSPVSISGAALVIKMPSLTSAGWSTR